LAEKTNIWDGIVHLGKWLSGTTLYTDTDVMYVVIPLIPQHDYVIKAPIVSDRFRWATFNVNPKDNSSNGIRSIYSTDSPTAGISFSFTAGATEYFLMGYIGHTSAGAANVIIHAHDMSTPDRVLKYLFRSEEVLYTIADGALVTLTESELSSSLFQAHGVAEIPTDVSLADLVDPEVLCWQDIEDAMPAITVLVTGVSPTPQTVITDVIANTHQDVQGVSSVVAISSGDVLYSISVDEGVSWRQYDPAQSSWCAAEEASGMSKDILNLLTPEIWNLLVTEKKFQIKFILPTVDSYVTTITVNYTVAS
jgi:hypothetical protein